MAGAPGEEERPAARGPLARRLAWVTAFCAVAGALIALFLDSADLEPAHAAAAPGDVAAPTPVADGVASDASPESGEPLPPAVERYLASTVYPPGTGRLTDAHQELLNPNARYEDFRRILDTYSTNPDEVVSVRLTADHYFYTGDEEVRLDLQVKQGERLIAPVSVDAGAIREGRAGAEGDRLPLRFHPEGDSLVARVDTATFADHHGPILVETQIEYWPGSTYDESLRLFLTPAGRIPARFTGEVEDELANGSLRVEIGIDVEQAGYYRLDANLYDRSGNPVAFSSFKGELDRSDAFVPIEFFGRTLRDVGAAGPFSVGEIRGYRFLDGQYPDRERIPDLPGRHRTSAYALTRFSETEYTSEHKQQMVRLMMEDVARGISIDAPPIPGAPAEATAQTASENGSPNATDPPPPAPGSARPN